MTSPTDRELLDLVTQAAGDAQQLARLIDALLNYRRGPDERQAFLLLWAPFGPSPAVNYISNCARDDATSLLKEILARWEGQPYVEGRG